MSRLIPVSGLKIQRQATPVVMNDSAYGKRKTLRKKPLPRDMSIEQDRQTEPSQYGHDQECHSKNDGIAEIDLKSGLAEQIGVNRADRP